MRIKTMTQEGFNHNHRYAGTYLHGKIESDYGFDIFSFVEKTDFKEGIHNIVIDGVKTVFFLWASNTKSKDIYQYRGYLVYRDDLDALNEGLEAYLDKEQLI